VYIVKTNTQRTVPMDVIDAIRLDPSFLENKLTGNKIRVTKNPNRGTNDRAAKKYCNLPTFNTSFSLISFNVQCSMFTFP